MKISIGIPCYNEEDNIQMMYDAVTMQMQALNSYDYEIIFGDNCSTDNSREVLRNIANSDCHVKVIFNQMNFGPYKSGVNIMMHSSGDAYINLVCDFQDPPEMIPTFIAEWEKGNQIVWGQKVKSKENPIKYFLRNVYYGIISALSDYKQIPHVTGFGITDKKVLDILLYSLEQDPDINIRHLVCEYGYPVKLIPYEQQKRARGKSSYNVSRYFDFAIDSLCNTTVKPLKLMVILGFMTAFFSFIVALAYFIYKLMHWNSFDAGIAPIIIGLFFVAAIQLLCIGILGQYLVTIIRKIKKRHIVIEEETINFDDKGNIGE